MGNNEAVPFDESVEELLDRLYREQEDLYSFASNGFPASPTTNEQLSRQIDQLISKLESLRRLAELTKQFVASRVPPEPVCHRVWVLKDGRTVQGKLKLAHRSDVTISVGDDNFQTIEVADLIPEDVELVRDFWKYWNVKRDFLSNFSASYCDVADRAGH